MIPTDWLLVRRLAAELEAALRGARLTDLGVLDDGRLAFAFSKDRTVAVDPFGSPPSVTLEDEAPALSGEPGWMRAAGATLRGMRLEAVRARRGDRVLVFIFGTSSRFGVRSEVRVVCELVPRFGNLVVLRDGVVVGAAKQFSPADNGTRSVQLGLPYEPPPLPPAERLVPKLLAGADEPSVLLAAAETAAADPRAPLHVYRDGAGAIAAAHVVALPGRPPTNERAGALLALLTASRAQTLDVQANGKRERRRTALLARIVKRRAGTVHEAAAIAATLADADGRERLRRAGDALYTHAHDVPPGATTFVPQTDPALTVELDPALDAKANARAYHARYRKASDAVPHLERRRTALDARLEALDVLAFETERADGATLDELERALDELEGRPVQRATVPSRQRAPLRLERPSGARIYVGRSPRENVDVTFRIARPDDLWFHARGIPGSHVVLQAPDGGTPDESDLDAAADLAAAHSRARRSGRVEIDFTERKYVRKQRDAPAGLVWYTNARTRLGVPERAPA